MIKALPPREGLFRCAMLLGDKHPSATKHSVHGTGPGDTLAKTNQDGP
jgi:hypothetical protein